MCPNRARVEVMRDPRPSEIAYASIRLRVRFHKRPSPSPGPTAPKGRPRSQVQRGGLLSIGGAHAVVGKGRGPHVLRLYTSAPAWMGAVSSPPNRRSHVLITAVVASQRWRMTHATAPFSVRNSAMERA